MKKIMALLVILVVVAGCNKNKYYTTDIKGTWKVYKFTLHGGDKSSDYANYNIFFGDNGHYSDLFTNADTTYATEGGAYNFENDGNQLVLTDTTIELVDTLWVSHVDKRKYSVYNLTSIHVQLRTDSSELYMEKLK